MSLIVWGFVIRVPQGGRADDTLAPVTEFFIWFLVLGALAALSAIGIAIVALRGHTVSHWAAVLLAATIAMTAWTYASTVPASIVVRVSGPGSRPGPELAQLAWPMLVAATALLLVGSVWAINTRLSASRVLVAVLSPWTAAGVAACTVAGLLVTSLWWPHIQGHPTTAAPIAVAPLPTALGTEVAYTVALDDPEHLLVAGPGFVTFRPGGEITAYDPVSGATRWTLTMQAFPKDCALDLARSTGAGPNAVVVAQCRRPQLLSVRPVGGGGEAVLMGFDANTGEQLWLNDAGFELPYGTGASESVVAVIRRDEEVGSLDPQTGLVRWVRPSQKGPCEREAHVIDDQIVTTPCYGSVDVRMMDGLTASEKTIALPVPLSTVPTDLEISVLATAGRLLVLQTASRYSSDPTRAARDRTRYMTLVVDISTGVVTFHLSAPGSNPRPPLPGSVVQLGSGDIDGQQYVDIYSMTDREVTRLQPFAAMWPAHDRFQWAQIGDDMVTGAASDERGVHIAVVASNGSVTRRPSLCPERADQRSQGAGIVPVPGAILMLCPPPGVSSDGWDLIGVR
ncbi:PQQ-binding-like beta-propeller repeat protein [Mycobacterium adipatum]|uniref:outer membrane protein assembly factor BamB family protein n=1 Tax=Mycobacterium adipatum TaxID=1682113 RepID=UPI0018D3E47D|nr:PQQ-binding-like beta-propeller repeat protein [Mycobacterium adipatum]